MLIQKAGQANDTYKSHLTSNDISIVKHERRILDVGNSLTASFFLPLLLQHQKKYGRWYQTNKQNTAQNNYSTPLKCPAVQTLMYVYIPKLQLFGKGVEPLNLHGPRSLLWAATQTSPLCAWPLASGPMELEGRQTETPAGCEGSTTWECALYHT